MEKFNEIKSILEESEKDFDAFYNNGVKAAGTRVRKAMLNIKNLAGDVRKEVSELKNQ